MSHRGSQENVSPRHRADSARKRDLSLRYLTGYAVLAFARLLRKCGEWLHLLAVIPEHLTILIWTPRELYRYSYSTWNSQKRVRQDSEPRYLARGLFDSERDLLVGHQMPPREILVLACGTGREAFALAKQGFRVTASDWSPRAIDIAQREALRANLSIQFDVADLRDLHYPENGFDYVMLANRGYSLLTHRDRSRLLKRARSCLKPGGLFSVSFAVGNGLPSSRSILGLYHALHSKLASYPWFNQEYERGDTMTVTGFFMHYFGAEGALSDEFEEGGFAIKELQWDRGGALLTPAQAPERLAKRGHP